MEPILNLIAKPGIIPPQMTFTRASTATYMGQDGLIKTAKSNQLRYDYDSTTLSDLGWMLEESRTNSHIYSEDYTQTMWTATQYRCSWVNSASTNPTGGANSYLLKEDNTASNSHGVGSGVGLGITANSPYTLSIFAKASGRSKFQMGLRNFAQTSGANANFDISAGSVGTVSVVGSGSGYSASIQAYPNGWYRCSLTVTVDNSSTAAVAAWWLMDNAWNTAYTGDSVSGIYFWGTQLEQGSFPTSYIPTTSAAVTRSQDILSTSINGFNPSNFSFFVDYNFTSSNVTTSTYNSVILNGSSSTNSADRWNLAKYWQASGSMFFNTWNGGSTSGVFKYKASDTNLNKVCVSLNRTSCTIVENGQLCLSSNVPPIAIPNAISNLYISGVYTGTNPMTGYVRRITVWNQSLSIDKMKDMTSPKLTNDLPMPSLNLTARDGYTPPQLTVTRASTATYTGSNGLVQIAPANKLRHDYDFSKMASSTNLLQYSNDVSNSYWNGNNIPTRVVTTATYDPNGTQTACKITPSSSNANQEVFELGGFTAIAGYYTMSIHAKAAGYNFLGMVVGNGTVSASGAFFNLSTGSIGSTASGVTTTMTSIGNGWYRCSVTKNLLAGARFAWFMAMPNNGSSDTFAGDGASGIYVYGPQLEYGVQIPGAYTATTTMPTTVITDLKDSYRGWLIEESRTNICTYSQSYSNWGKSGTNATDNVVAAPDGTTTASKITEDATNASHLVYGNSPSTTANTPYTVSCFIKAAGRYIGQLDMTGGVLNWGGSINFDLSRGVVSKSNDYGNITGFGITPYPNGWYRIWITATTSATEWTIGNKIWFSNGSTYSYTGDGVSGYYVWGAQTEQGAFLTSYIPTTSSAATRSGDIVSMSTSMFNFNTSQGTLFSEYDTFCNSSDPAAVAFRFDDGTTGNVLQNGVWAGVIKSWITPSTPYTIGSFGSSVVGSPIKQCMAYSASDQAAVVNGSAPSTISQNVPTGLTNVCIGHAGAGNGYQIDGHIKRVTYWPKRLSNSVLQKITR